MQSNHKVNGWTYDPAQQAWTAKVGPARWLKQGREGLRCVQGDLDDAPTFRPQAIA